MTVIRGNNSHSSVLLGTLQLCSKSFLSLGVQLLAATTMVPGSEESTETAWRRWQSWEEMLGWEDKMLERRCWSEEMLEWGGDAGARRKYLRYFQEMILEWDEGFWSREVMLEQGGDPGARR